MSYVHRNLLPLTIGLLASVAILIGMGNVVMRFVPGDQISDEQFSRELGRRLDGATQGNSATLGLQLDAELQRRDLVASPLRPLAHLPRALAERRHGGPVGQVGDADHGRLLGLRCRVKHAKREALSPHTV